MDAKLKLSCHAHMLVLQLPLMTIKQLINIVVEGPVFSRWFRILIFSLWFNCVLEGFNLPKNDVAIFSCDFFILFSQFQIMAQIVLNNFIKLPQNTFSIQNKHSV